MNAWQFGQNLRTCGITREIEHGEFAERLGNLDLATIEIIRVIARDEIFRAYAEIDRKVPIRLRGRNGNACRSAALQRDVRLRARFGNASGQEVHGG